MKFFKVIASTLALCAAFSIQARSLDDIKKSGKIIVATEGQFAPFNYFKGTTADGLRSRSGGAGRQEDGPEAGVEDPGL
jgi:ABC-type amino acid transport substrate-binding protein